MRERKKLVNKYDAAGIARRAQEIAFLSLSEEEQELIVKAGKSIAYFTKGIGYNNAITAVIALADFLNENNIPNKRTKKNERNEREVSQTG